MAAEDAERQPARRVSGGAMYDPARDAWADRDDNAWPQRSLDHQHQHQHQPSSPAAAQARPASPVNVVPGPVSFPPFVFLCTVLRGWSGSLAAAVGISGLYRCQEVIFRVGVHIGQNPFNCFFLFTDQIANAR